MRAPGRLAAGAVGVLVLGFGTWTFSSLLEARAERAEMERLRGELRDSRMAADSCQVAVTREEMRFREYDARVDSLRESVAEFEAMDPEGVPAAEYETYLETFEAYNRSVPEWSERADTLQAREQACWLLIEEHNLLTDSVGRRLEGLGTTPREAGPDAAG